MATSFRNFVLLPLSKQPPLSFASAKESSKPACRQAGKSRADFPACRQAGMRKVSSLDPHQAKIGVE
jgi:hypothetical protein